MKQIIPIISMCVGSFLVGGALGMKIMDDEDYICEDEEHEFENDEESVQTQIAMKEQMREIVKEYDGSEEVEAHEDVKEESEEDAYDPYEEDEPDNSDPHLISIDSFNNEFETYSKNTLTYFEGDGVVVDDRDEVIVNYVDYIGENALDTFGEMSDSPDVTHIRNPHKEADYEIWKDPTSYQQTILGLDDPYDSARKYFNLDQDREE